MTTQGNIYVALYPEWAPLTVTNFLNLMNRGFYDNNPWFRIVPDFVVQTGEQDAKNTPGPGYTIPAEENPLEQNSYVISMGLDYNDRDEFADSRFGGQRILHHALAAIPSRQRIHGFRCHDERFRRTRTAH